MSKGYDVKVINDVDDLKEELQTMQLTRIIESYRKGMWYIIFIDDSTKKAVTFTGTVKFEELKIVAWNF
jgi:ribosomal protein L21E